MCARPGVGDLGQIITRLVPVLMAVLSLVRGELIDTWAHIDHPEAGEEEEVVLASLTEALRHSSFFSSDTGNLNHQRSGARGAGRPGRVGARRDA